jgi:SAM-dependent methyltransferase
MPDIETILPGLVARSPAALEATRECIAQVLYGRETVVEYRERQVEPGRTVQSLHVEYTPWNWSRAGLERRMVERWLVTSEHDRDEFRLERRVEGVRAGTRLAGIDKDPNALGLHPLALPSPLAAEFSRIQQIKGWFTFDDYVHFTMSLRLQSQLGLAGDILEIGCYHGRSTCVLARHLREGERLVVCDIFEGDSGEQYSDPPTVESVRRSVLSFVPALDPGRLDFRACRSDQLELTEDDKFRFVHVDGAHEASVALHDIRLAARHLTDRGIVVVDDYQHCNFPGVSLAVEEFLKTSPDFRVLFDLNRREEEGRKVYLCKGE